MEEKIEIGSKALEFVTCSNCQKSILGSEATCFSDKDGNDVYMCSDCKELVDEAYERESENPNYLGAVLLGLLAGVVSAVIWYIIEIATQRIIGYVALGAGYLIGLAVLYGSGKKRGPALQLISAAITLISIFGASYFSALYFINDYIKGQVSKLGVGNSQYLWVSPFNSGLLEMIISPVGIIIWGIGIYIAFKIPKKRSI